jgi:hypothetical protein
MRDRSLFIPSRLLGHERPRSAVIVLVLLLTLGMAGALGYQALNAARSHRAAADNVLRDYAVFASWELSQTTRRVLNEVLGVQLTRLASTCASGSALPDVSQWVQTKDG